LPTVKKWIFHGVDQDIVQLQQRDSRHSRTKRLEKMHSRAAHYDNQTEHLYSFLQVLTASTQSFAHGSNDVANAVGPLATIYLVWQTDTLATTVPVPIWVLAFGGAAIVLGFATWGYNVMKNLGNRLTLHSPSRGFSMELGSALTVLLASRLGLPVSTAQCIVGATIAVGLCNGDWKAMNWRMAVWIFGGWILTVPVTAVMAGCIMGFVINAPRWNG
jgi:sodium-dependent phosphate transporter